ncbi:MAG: hypothetical protein ACRCY8_07170, partial [Dermatophilaceae bacterium]
SDALDMAGASGGTDGIGIPEAAVRALAAGVDLLCLGSGGTEERFADVHAAILDAVGSGRLPRGRVTAAAARVRDLAARPGGAARHGGPATPPHASPTPTVSSYAIPAEVVVRAFQLSDDARAWLADPAPAVVVQVGGRTNLAVGEVAWGPAALGAATAEATVRAGDKAAVVGRGVGLRHPARDAVARLRERGHHVVLVECGWPRGGADVETFGGSPAVARTLLALLHGEVAAP